MSLVSKLLENGFNQQDATVFNRKLFLLVLVNYHIFLHVKRDVLSLAIRAHCVCDQVVKKALYSVRCKGLSICIMADVSQV